MRAFGVRRRRRADGEAGQSLVEFSLILFPLFFILLGIIQFGLIFNTYVTMTNAARDAARLGTIYIYTRESGETQVTNDLARNESIKTQVLTSMNMLGKVALTRSACSSGATIATSTGWREASCGTTMKPKMSSRRPT